eukprot:gene15575-6844_t
MGTSESGASNFGSGHGHGNPIFCVDIHPDGSRCATGGQVDDTGRIFMWNMAPVVDAQVEEDENVPRMLCVLDNHSGCVNCLRWSNSGKYLASGADDKFIMIWQLGRGFGSSTVFGSGGTIVNIEHWRCAHILRGHSGDILDIAWSPDDRFLASGSVDNTVNIWSAEKFPDLITTLKGHQGLVKGVTWDPVGKYFASQSDDKTMKIWRTSDWKLEAKVVEPFDECGGTTHVLRLNWSPDGQYVVSAHAMNNGGPVAKIIERDGWKGRMDFVGHRKAITCVRFNSRLFTKPSPNDPSKFKQYACCAIGSRDRSLSIWNNNKKLTSGKAGEIAKLTSLKRPLVVTHDLFQSSIMDLSWSRCGYRLLVCSLDGTLAYLDFTAAELGKAMTDQEKLSYHKQTYGTSIVSSKSNFAASIIENPEVLEVHQQQQQQERLRKAFLAQQSLLNSPSHSKISFPNASQITWKSSDGQNLSKAGSFTSGSTDNKEAAMMVLKQQKETRTKDGRRRITPLMIASPLDLSDSEFPSTADVYAPNVQLQESDSNLAHMLKSAPTVQRPQSVGTTTSITSVNQKAQPRSSTPNKKGLDTTQPDLTTTTATQNLTATPKRKGDSVSQTTPAKRGRKEKDKTKEKQNKDDSFMLLKSREDKLPEHAQTGTSRPSSPGLVLQPPKVEKHLSLRTTETKGKSEQEEIVFEIDNNIQAPGASSIHILRCTKKETTTWEAYLTSPATALACSELFVCVACQNKSLHVFSKQGRRIMPTMVLSSQIAILQCSCNFMFVVTASSYVSVWDVTKREVKIAKEPIHHLIKGTSINRTFITETGVPIISLQDSSSYAFSESLNTWIQISNSEDPLQSASTYHGSVPGKKPSGMLTFVQSSSDRLMRPTAQNLRMNSSKQQSCTISHLENQLCSALVLRSSEEYQFWFMTYVRYLVQSGEEQRLRELCEDLIGPCHRKSEICRENSWQPKILV